MDWRKGPSGPYRRASPDMVLIANQIGDYDLDHVYRSMRDAW